MARSFNEMVAKKWKADKFLCLALDSDFDNIPPPVRSYVAGMSKLASDILFRLNKIVINETADFVAAYSFNVSSYLAYAKSGGIEALVSSIHHIIEKEPDIPIILEAPLNPGDSFSNQLLANVVFKEFAADAVMVSPLPGENVLKPLLMNRLKGIIVACHSDQESGKEFQDAPVYSVPEKLMELLNGPARSLGRDISGFPQSMPLYQYIAHRVANHWNISENCWLGFQLSRPEEINRTRKIVDDLPFFIKTDSKDSLRGLVTASLDSNKRGFLVSVSDIILTLQGTDFRDKIVQEINKVNKEIKEIRA